MKHKVILFVLMFAIAFPTIGYSATYTFTKNFGVGSRGDFVKELQIYMANDLTVYPEGLVTGYFGPATERAVKRFQKANGLPEVGNVGPRTRALLNQFLSKGVPTSSRYVPMIFEIFATSTTPTTAYLFWSTNMSATSEIWLNTTNPIDTINTNKIVDSKRGIYHYYDFSGLNPNTTYYYVIKITDDRGNSATSTERSFTTPLI